MTITAQPPADSTGETPHPHHGSVTGRGGRRLRWAITAIAASAAIVVGVLVWATDDATDETAVAPLQLSMGQGDSLASCLPFEVGILSGMPTAFAATVTASEGETVTLQVDRWYAGDTGANTVQLAAPAGMEALIGGFAFTVGEHYLITATDGTVNYCGYSALATPEMTDAFNQAFPG